MNNLLKNLSLIAIAFIFSSTITFAQDKGKESHKDKVDKCVKEKRDRDMKENPIGRRIHDKTARQLDRLKCDKKIRDRKRKKN